MHRLAWLFVLACAPVLQASAQKNIVMFVTDDQGLDAGCYGNKVIRTPNIDRLASEGTRFTQAFCTTSSCSPSRATILTGLYNHTSGQYGLQHAAHDFKTHDWVRGLPVLLRAAGYRSAALGKFHVQPEPLYHFDLQVPRAENVVKLAERAEEFIREKPEQPFFLYFCTTEPHRAKKGFGNDAKRGIESVKYDPADVELPNFLPKRPEVAEELAEYYEAISRADQGLGRVLRALEATGHRDDTLLIFLSDNGMPFPNAKTNLYDPGVHLPLVIRNPGQKSGVACDAMVSWVDLAPTVLEFAKAKAPAYRLPGRSLLGILEQEHPADWDEVYLTHTFHEITMYYPMRAIRTRQYKLIMNIAHQLPWPIAADLYGSRTWQGLLEAKADMVGPRSMSAYVQRPHYELYDLQKDPLEVENLADRPEHQAVLRDLQIKLRDWQNRSQDPWTIKYQHE